MEDETESGDDGRAAEAADKLVRATWGGTVVFVLTAGVAVLVEAALIVSVPVALLLFAIGVVTFAMAFLRSAGRSRSELVTVPGTYFLVGSAPAGVARSMRLALAVQVIVALATAAIRPFSGVAFGILVPMFGLGMIGLWGARHGRFEPRPVPAGPKRSRESG
ncbi:MAG: hypothetical protein HKN26_11975 [Acidimicrobiales bacterium]|nr:hypothetical protein [Acidimicrobiales bacterium]